MTAEELAAIPMENIRYAKPEGWDEMFPIAINGTGMPFVQAHIYSGEDVDCYILTDDAELGAKDVLSMMHICDLEAERDVAFVIVDFTTYFG